MLVREKRFTEIAQGGGFPQLSFIFMLLSENWFIEVARGGVLP